MRTLTAKQQAILDFLTQYIGERDLSPTLTEIGAKFDLSLSTVHKHLTTLQDKGYITRRAGLSRSSVPVGNADICPTCGHRRRAKDSAAA